MMNIVTSSSCRLRRLLLCMAVVLTTCGGAAAADVEQQDMIPSPPPPPIAGSDVCGVWVAMSSLPGTGVGMFAGKDFQKGDFFMTFGDTVTGDHIIPIVDIRTNHKGISDDEFFFLWDEYTWDAASLGLSSQGVGEVVVASPGFGATANSFLDFVNVGEGTVETSLTNKNWHRSKDPGVGAFTYHHTRKAHASKSIAAGNELFVSYGSAWFTERKVMEQVPIQGDHSKAEVLYRRFHRLFLLNNNNNATSEKKQKMTTIRKPYPKNIVRDLWSTFVTDDDIWKSRVFASLPSNKNDYKTMLGMGLLNFKQKFELTRSKEWLEEHGVCADLLYMNASSVPQAGHGAFASVALPKGTAILPIPLIHIPDRSILRMRDPDEIAGDTKRKKSSDRSRTVNHQLLLNYCLGHRDSSMLLSPYGPIFNMVNHNQSQANVRLQWASTERSNHHPEVLERHVDWFDGVKSSMVAMELITLKDILPGEEIFLDYGNEWEAAWQHHIATWKPVPGAEDYVPALELNAKEDLLRTEFEQLTDPYPSNIIIKFDPLFEKQSVWEKTLLKNGNLTELRETSTTKRIQCEILKRTKVIITDATKSVIPDYWLYTAVIVVDETAAKKEYKTVKGPREAFWFEDRPYTADSFLPNAFRHDIRIPDDMFPEAWKNAKSDLTRLQEVSKDKV